MRVCAAYIEGIHENSFRCGDMAKIINVKMVEPDNGEARLCFEVVYDDHVLTWIPLSDALNPELYEITDEMSLLGR